MCHNNSSIKGFVDSQKINDIIWLLIHFSSNVSSERAILAIIGWTSYDLGGITPSVMFWELVMAIVHNFLKLYWLNPHNNITSLLYIYCIFMEWIEWLWLSRAYKQQKTNTITPPVYQCPSVLSPVIWHRLHLRFHKKNQQQKSSHMILLAMCSFHFCYLRESNRNIPARKKEHSFWECY